MTRIAAGFLLSLVATSAIGQELLRPIDVPAAEGNYVVTGYVVSEPGGALTMFEHRLTNLELHQEGLRAEYNGEQTTGDWDRVREHIAVSFRPKEGDLFFLGIIATGMNGAVIRGHWSGVEDAGMFAAHKIE